jgi:hypothetical protein
MGTLNFQKLSLGYAFAQSINVIALRKAIAMAKAKHYYRSVSKSRESRL